MSDDDSAEEKHYRIESILRQYSWFNTKTRIMRSSDAVPIFQDLFILAHDNPEYKPIFANHCTSMSADEVDRLWHDKYTQADAEKARIAISAWKDDTRERLEEIQPPSLLTLFARLFY